MEEPHGRWVAAVFAADADLEVRPAGPAFGDGDLDQSSDAVAVDGTELHLAAAAFNMMKIHRASPAT